jgi:hypothetical protein
VNVLLVTISFDRALYLSQLNGPELEPEPEFWFE